MDVKDTYDRALAYYNERNYAEANKLFQKLADDGHAQSQFDLGYAYDRGLGVDRDVMKCIEWYQKAADQGHTTAICNLGCAYYNGLDVALDYKKAAEMFQKACDLGHRVACHNLARMYQHGLGVDKNIEKALDLYKKAIDLGYKDSISASVNILLDQERYTDAIDLISEYEQKGIDTATVKARLAGYLGLSKLVNICISLTQKCKTLEDDNKQQRRLVEHLRVSPAGYEQAMEDFKIASQNGII
jgi:TPR repeat protein